jgi:hypothetical protein
MNINYNLDKNVDILQKNLDLVIESNDTNNDIYLIMKELLSEIKIKTSIIEYTEENL